MLVESGPTDVGGPGYPHGGHWCCWLRVGQPMAVHPNRQLFSWTGAGYFPVLFHSTQSLTGQSNITPTILLNGNVVRE